MNELDDDWLDSDDEEYMGDEGALDDSTTNDREPLDLAQDEPDSDSITDIINTSITTVHQTSTQEQQPLDFPPPSPSVSNSTASPLLDMPVL